MTDAMRPAPEAVRPRGHEAADEAGEAARVGQNEAGPREAGEATQVGQVEATVPLAPVQPAPVGQSAQGPASLYKASTGASRIAAKGEKAKAEAEAEAIRMGAKTDQQIRLEAAHEANEAKRKAAKLASKEARQKAMREAVGRVAGAVGRGLTYARENAGGVFSMGIYLAAVGVAAGSQAHVAHTRFEWDWTRSIGAAAFIEGLSLAFALTGHRLRLDGENAYVPRALTWAAASFGAYVNYEANVHTPGLDPTISQVMAIVLAISSLAGITLWEVRTSAHSRKAMRKAEKTSDPKAKLGLDLLIRDRKGWFWAWSAMVLNPKVRTRSEALRVGAEMRADRAYRKAVEAQRKRALRVEATVQEAAERAIKKAAKKGEAGPALAALAQLREHGLAALEARLALEAGPSASKAGLTIEGAVVAPGAGPRPTAHEAGPGPLAYPAPGPRPTVDEAARVAHSAPSAPWPTTQEAGPRPTAHEAGPTFSEATGPRAGANPAGGPTAPGGEAAAPGPVGQGAGVEDLGAARDEHEARLDELSDMFPYEIPSRQKVLKLAKAMTDAGHAFRFKWSSNRTIDKAIQDLRKRRSQAA